jgi:hypothetical protein
MGSSPCRLDHTLFALRWGVTLSLSVAVLAAGVFAGGRGVLNGRWLGRGLRPTAMLLTLACVVVFVWLPWQAVYWRPAGLAASAEPAFVAAKLAAVALVASLGWALILGAGARGAGIDADDSSIGHRPSSIT